MSAQRDCLRVLFDAAVEAVQPHACLAGRFPDPPDGGRLVILAVGKASREMMAAAEQYYGARIDAALVVFPREGEDGGPDPDPGSSAVRHIAAGHPDPDENSVLAARRAKSMVRGLAAEDHVLVLLSGGASALMAEPLPGFSLSRKAEIIRSLMHAGAPINVLNTVRKHLSAIKGGRLALAAWPARLHTLAISDVVGDDPAMIGSGPTAGDTSTCDHARSMIRQYLGDVPADIEAVLARPDAETPEPDVAPLRRARFDLVATGRDALAAAATVARERFGLTVEMLGDDWEGEASELAYEHAQLYTEEIEGGTPVCFLSGGEVTTEIGETAGRGGPNMEYALALALALDGTADMAALAADTDGGDGNSGYAGAFIDSASLARAVERNLDAAAFLEGHDSAAFFEALGDTLTTGPTGTNVNDFRAVLIGEAAAR